ncbi:MAG: hypothetical protein AAF298_26215 [Cyanobacteria bacterium P01_A01_bin.40]
MASVISGQHPHHLFKLSSEQLGQAKAEIDIELEILNTEQEIWNNATIFSVF